MGECVICTEENRYIYNCDKCSMTCCLECIQRLNKVCPQKCGSTKWLDPTVSVGVDGLGTALIAKESFTKTIGDVTLVFGYFNTSDGYRIRRVIVGGVERSQFSTNSVMREIFNLGDKTVIFAKYSVVGVRNPRVSLLTVEYFNTVKVPRQLEIDGVTVTKIKTTNSLITKSLSLRQEEGDPDDLEGSESVVEHGWTIHYMCNGCGRIYTRPKMCAKHAKNCTYIVE